jgi:hypothetical protein
MRCSIVKMRYRSWGTSTVPAVQDLGKRFEYFSQNYPWLNFFPSGSQSMKIPQWMFRNSMSIVFGVTIVCHSWRDLIGRYIRYLPMIIMLQRLRPVTNHDNGSRQFAIVQARRVTVLRVRLVFAAVHWLMYGEPNELKKF